MIQLCLRWACLLLILPATLSEPVWAANWPGWRGPRGDGTSTETDIPVRWSATDNIAWKVKMPYGGHASPIVWGDRVFLVGAESGRKGEEKDRMLLALDRRTGKKLWERAVVHAPLERLHHLNSHASSTPATDGERVYVSFLNRNRMLVAAYDFQGRELWKVQPGEFSSVHGYCSSPVLFEDKVIINGDHDGDAYLVALDRRTGQTVWKTPRENKTRSYCTPIIRTIGDRTQLILSGSKCVASYDPHDGARHWIIDGPTEQFVASPVFNAELIFITGGFPERHVLTIDPTGSGNVTQSHIRWHHERRGASYVPSPIAVSNYFLVVSDNGIGTCHDAVTGKILWQKRMGRHYSGSLVSAAGLVYFLDDDGITKVVRPGPDYDEVAENDLNEACRASPALSQGQIFIRGTSYLYCIGQSRDDS